MNIRRSDDRSRGHRRWLLGLAAALGALAMVAPASAGAKASVSASVVADPACGFVGVSGDWRAVPGQSYVAVELNENQTGDTLSSAFVAVSPTATSETVEILGALTPLAHGKHVLKGTFTVYDGNLNPIVSGKANGNMACALSGVVLPT